MTLEIARRLVAKGHSVEWFSAYFDNATPEETIDGIRVVRRGRQWTVHWQAFKYYRHTIRDRFDVVIDEVNTMPFFTPMWAGIRNVMLVFQLAREVWWYESPFPLSLIGYLLEPLYLRRYRGTPALTISESTARDLRALGFQRPITIVPIGIDQVAVTEPKQSEPTFIYVGRIAPSKRIDHLLRAFAEFRSRRGTGALWLVGSGSQKYDGHLKRLAEQLGVGTAVTFHGSVPATRKFSLMARAHLLLMASVREGWGLVVTEASRCGTPAVVYDVPGLRDSVRNEKTGLIVKPAPAAMCEAMVRIWDDPGLYERLATEGRSLSSSLTFDESAQTVDRVLSQAAAL